MLIEQLSGRRERRIRSYLAAVAAFALAASAVPPPPGVAPVTSPSGGFAIDGQLCAGTWGDWVPGTGGASVLRLDGTSLNPASTFHFLDVFNTTSDLVFAGGLKWTDDPNLWQWTASKASSKTDINNVLMHVSTDAAGHTWLIVAADRASTSGDSYIDFEFLQNTLTRTNAGRFVSDGPHGGRTVNDLLLSLAFTSGGSIADFFAFRWQPAGSGYNYIDATSSFPTGRVFVAASTNNTAVPFGAFGSATYAANAFAEAAVDLTALLGSFDPCLSIGIKTVLVKTKSSQSSTASISDFIDPIDYSMKLGPSANAGADQVRCDEGGVTTFPLAGQATQGTEPLISTAWSVVSGDAVIDSPSSLVTTARVASASAVLRLTVMQANGCTETDEVLLSVAPNPAGSIAGPSLVCPRSSTQFTGPAGMASYAWSVEGNAALLAATNARTVTVTAGPACGTNFTLRLNVGSNLCYSACSAEVQVNDTNAPILHCPSNIVLECPAQTGTNVTGMATAEDDCAVASISFSDTVTNICGGARLIVRTWSATDLCGNMSTANQVITVRDTRPPLLVCPPNITLECPAEAGTNLTGTAMASDACGAVAVTYSDVVSNVCGNAKVILRTWRADDECGNWTTAVQIVTVRDTRPPALLIPADVTLECPADTGTNATGVAAAVDACGQTVVTYSDIVSNGCGGTRIVSRLWTATDECGNTTNRLQTITVRDTTAPSLIAPASLVLECPADTGTNATGTAFAQDACGSVLVTYSDSVSNGCGGTKIIQRLWTAADACGNASNVVQVIAVKDTKAPSLVCPPNLVLECPADTTTNATGVALAQDACGSVTVQYTDAVTNGCGGSKTIVRTWTAVDSCGNSTNAVQWIQVKDTRPPTLVCPPNLVLECPADVGTNATGTAFAQDACSPVNISFVDAVTNGCGGSKTISRLWTATDTCGNATNAVQLISVRDTTAPALSCPPNLVLECPADLRTNVTGSAMATDGCSTVAVTYTDSVTNGCGGTKTVARTWTATDACGNRTNAVQLITVRDTTPPALRLPANLVQECPGDLRTNVTGTAVALESCGSATITYSDFVTNGCGLTKTVLRLWTATDECGNTTNGVQTIAVVDTKPPTIVCPALKVQCAGDVPAPYASLTAFLTAGGSASDACGQILSFGLVSDSGLVGSCPGKVTRVYRATDQCGNSADATQTITVDDTIAPVLSCPTNITVECGLDALWTNRTGVARATDNCDTNVTVTYTDATVPSQYSLKWYAADQSANSGPYQPTYVKLSPASLPCPDTARLTGRALDPLRNAVAYGPSASQLDALTSMGADSMCFGQIVPFEAVIEVGGGPGPEHGRIQFTSTWSTHTTSNDEFGYDKNYMVYCAFVDAADPGSVDPHNNARVDSYNATIVNAGTVDEKIQGTFQVSGLDSGDRVVVEIWVVLKATAPRNFGGTIASDLLSAQKLTSPPEPLSTGAQTVSIGSLSKLSALPSAQPQPPLGPLPLQPPVPAGMTVSVIDRTWAAADACGNRSTCVQRITVRDTTAPTLAVPPDLVLECPADVTTNSTGNATAQDGCGLAMVTYSDAVTNGCGGTKVIARTWTALDEAGNGTNRTQWITVRDTAAPALSVPSDLVLEAPADASTARTGSATAQDACGSATVTSADSVQNGIGANKIISRVWTAVDACGNATNATQTLTIRDTRAPVLTLPANLVLEVPADTSTNSTGTATAEDISGPVTISFADVVTNICGASRFIARTWTATDACGLTSTGVQTILVRDTTAPKIGPAVTATHTVAEYRSGTVLEAAFTAVFSTGLRIGSGGGTNGPDIPNELYWEPSQSGLSALLACLATGDASSGPLQRDETNPSQTAGGGELARQTIALSLNIGFNKAGMLGAVANNFGGMRYASSGDALDGLTVDQLLAQANAALAGLGLPAGYTYQQMAALVSDLNAAFAGGAASDWAAAHLDSPILVVQCASQVPAPGPSQVTVSDNSSNGVSVLALPDTLLDYVNSNRFVLQRTWVAEDACGNTNTTSFRIAVDDTLPPRLSINARRMLAVGQPWTFDEPTAVDNCGTASVRVLNTSTNLTATNLVATRTWEASDVAGNTSTCEQTITVPLPAPLVAPTITAQPQGQTAEFGGTTTLTVTASGSGPFSYQWRLNGQNLAGATGSALVLTGVQYTNAGVYSVLVSNGAGVASSPAALVNVAPRLRSVRAGNGLRLSWDSPFILQSAATVVGPYSDVPDAVSPYEPKLAGVQQVFYRLRSPGFSLSTRYLEGGQMLVEVQGAPGWNYVLQASSNLSDWVPLCTNTAPCSYVDAQAALYGLRMYRVVPIETRASVPAAPPVITSQPLSRTAGYGTELNLTAAAAGASPMTYQWRCNGTAIPGATGSSFSFKNLQYTNAGLYSVVVGNGGGTVISAAAVIDVAPRLVSQVAAKTLTLNWAGPFSLQSAPNPAGPYSTMANASGPYVQNLGGAIQKYFRLVGEPFTVRARTIVPGQVAVDVMGAPGRNLVLQSSSDLKNWVNLQTNTAPWTWVDSSSGTMKVFRAIPAQ